ncbi:hypothetical protein AAOE16_12230 [Ekhidna sp. MALMAid0563]|uniref:hypothetical protein n=1 Tax=Ekhidna sp. MALMAid0563 TaxID=3143937 RepID=UPI0032E0252B
MKYIPLILFISLLPLFTIAQVDPEIERETYVVINDSTKVYGQIIEQKNMYSIYRQISFLADGEMESIEYKPEDILSFKWKYTVYETVSDRFMKVAFKGDNISLYEFGDFGSYSSPSTIGANGMMISPGHASSQASSEYFIKMKGEELKKVKKIGFRKEYSKMFNDCERVSKMIKSKALTYDNLETIVTLYDRCN